MPFIALQKVAKENKANSCYLANSCSRLVNFPFKDKANANAHANGNLSRKNPHLAMKRISIWPTGRSSAVLELNLATKVVSINFECCHLCNSWPNEYMCKYANECQTRRRMNKELINYVLMAPPWLWSLCQPNMYLQPQFKAIEERVDAIYGF